MNTRQPLALDNARVILQDRELERSSVVVESGLITRVADAAPAIPGAQTIDLTGMVLLPGFIDVHIHGSAGIDVMDATAEQLNEIGVFLASEGITGWVPTFVPAAGENYASGVEAIAKAAGYTGGARVLGVHYEGPFVNTAQCGALHTEFFKTYSTPADIDRLPAPGELVRMITLAPEIDGGIELIRELEARGWVISIGHTRASLELLDQA
ncbi:MAG TPA: hypothetical protein VHQ94_12090, partial [Pyrinomonadaceae bacterium]|nr:hypothetical protein [Pyrinomonadaceae bacterium]